MGHGFRFSRNITTWTAGKANDFPGCTPECHTGIFSSGGDDEAVAAVSWITQEYTLTITGGEILLALFVAALTQVLWGFCRAAVRDWRSRELRKLR
jgi:hypothetical protein